MGNLLAFAGSNSSTSINFQLVKHTASKVKGHDIQLLNMANYPFPIYSSDIEKAKGFSNSLVELHQDIQKADGLIISVNEYNSGLSAYFKNVLDWLSRIDTKFLKDKHVLVLATSPGKRGATSALETAESMFTRFGAEVFGTFSLPSFGTNYDQEKGIVDAELAAAHQDIISEFTAKLAAL